MDLKRWLARGLLAFCAASPMAARAEVGVTPAGTEAEAAAVKARALAAQARTEEKDVAVAEAVETEAWAPVAGAWAAVYAMATDWAATGTGSRDSDWPSLSSSGADPARPGLAEREAELAAGRPTDDLPDSSEGGCQDGSGILSVS